LGAVVLTNFHWGAAVTLLQASLDAAADRDPGPTLAALGDLDRFTGAFGRNGRPVARVERRGDDLFLEQRDRVRRLTPAGIESFVVSEPSGRDAIFLRGREEPTLSVEGDGVHPRARVLA